MAGRACVLSGATGFLGSRIAGRLVGDGVTVIAPVRADTDPSRLHKACGDRSAGSLILVDAAPDGLVSRIVGSCRGEDRASGPPFVLHAATCYGRNGESDAELRAVNVELGCAMLEVAQALGAAGFVNVDTVLSASLGRYAASKAAFRSHLRGAAVVAGMPIVNLRLEMLYGPGDSGHQLVSWLIARCLAGDEELALGRGDRAREFVHVEDAAAACVAVLDGLPRLQAGWHETRVGGETATVRAVAESVRELSGASTVLRFGAREDRSVEIDDQLPDDALLRAHGWVRRIRLATGLREMVEGMSR